MNSLSEGGKMAKTAVVFMWALMAASLCTLAYASHAPESDSVIVGGEDGSAVLVRSIHFGRELLTSRSKRRTRIRKSRKKKRTRNCNGSKRIVNNVTSRGGGGGGGGSGGFLGDGGDGGDGGDSNAEPQSVNLCVSGESRRNNNQNIRINLD
ncbi:hypothetical protein BSKO_12354 [Bryopsis sp. KO-2023]|nr:hypothetical protein BSKO_12354 [Bryopsis sp. KO-2023]